jgi:hypothetical protein
MRQSESVIDVFSVGDAAVPELMVIEELASRWQCHPVSACRCLQRAGVRLVKLYGVGDSRLHIRLSDVRKLEKTSIIFLQPFKRPATNRARSYAKKLTI